MINAITITVTMIVATLLALVATPLNALAQVTAGGTVGTGELSKIPLPEFELHTIPGLSDLPKADVDSITD